MEALVRHHCSPAQFTRFRKVSREPFYVLEASQASHASHAFVVSGSTGSPYRMTVSVTAGDDDAAAGAVGRIRCSCMDAALNCGRLGVACKHMCFLVSRVFRLDAEAVKTYLSTLRLRPADLAAIAALGAIRTGRAAAAQAASEDDLLCEAFSSKARVREGDAELPDFLAVKRPPEPGDDCPVCYCELVAGSGTLVGCPDCGNGLHAECARRWLAHSPAATCVYCRSTVWKKYRGRAP